MTYKTVKVPVTGDVEVVYIDVTGDAMAAQIGPENGMLDFVTMRGHSYQVAVDDTGAIDGKPLNARATGLVRLHGYRGVLFGDALVLGLHPESGETLDVPEEVVALLLEAKLAGE